MLTVLYGDDELFKEFRVKRELKEKNQRLLIINTDKKKELDELFPLIFTNSMFGESYVAYLRKFDSLGKSMRKTYLQKLDVFRESNSHKVFLDVEEKIKDDSLVQEMFQLPKPWKREEWEFKVRQISGMFGLRLKKQQIEKLLDLSGNNLAFIKNEIEKLAVVSENYVIDDTLFSSLLFSNSAENAEQFVFDFLYGYHEKAVSQYAALLGNMAPQQLIYQICRNSVILQELMNKIPAKEKYSFEEMKNYSRETGYSIPVISKFTGFAFRQSERKPCLLLKYDKNSIENLLIILWDVDYEIKNGLLDPSSAMVRILNEWSA